MAQTYPCYFIVTPDPAMEGSYIQEGNEQCFYVKFGDGSAEGNLDAYARSNPAFRIVGNDSCLNNVLEVPANYNGDKIKTKPGKFLEWIFIKHQGAHLYEGTEWHRICVKDGFTAEQVRLQLVSILKRFAAYQWGEDGVDAEFQKLVLSTWELNNTSVPGKIDDHPAVPRALN